MTDKQESRRAPLPIPVPPGSPLAIPFVAFAVATLLLLVLSGGYSLFFSFRGPPVPPPDNRYRTFFKQTQGEASVHDGFFLLSNKAGFYELEELAAYLQELPAWIVDGKMVWLPGDFKISSINWKDPTRPQSGLLADGKTRVEIPPDALAELMRRGDRVIELGASPDPPHPPPPEKTPGLP